jgi:hypothetical protein
VTIVTVPSKRESNLLVIVCDECKRDIKLDTDANLPPPWREVEMRGWIGAMHACSDDCEIGIRSRHEDRTPTVQTPIPNFVVDDEEDTKP